MTERGGNYLGNPFHAGNPLHAEATLSAAEGRLLDPATAVTIQGVVPRSTAYVGERLLVSKAADLDGAVRVLGDVAAQVGWSVETEVEDRRTADLRFGTRAIRVEVAAGAATTPPDAWSLLQQTRAQYGLESTRGVALDHVVSGWPTVEGGPYPLAYTGPAPVRASEGVLAARRPVIGVVDTSCDRHPWLDEAVVPDPTLDGTPIGSSAPAPHGTFMAGLVHQGCPDADIVPWGVVSDSGMTTESDLIAALAQVAELVRRFRDGEADGHPVDVLVVSTGYHHEAPEGPLLDPTLHDVLADLARHGTVIVCPAGDDGTSRPTFPAAFGPWADGGGPVQVGPDAPPILSVGALDPDGVTESPFSNGGPWVRAHAVGAELMSTVPSRDGRPEFGRWSGTAFAASVLAAQVARRIEEDLTLGDDTDTAVARAWSAVMETTSITL